MMRIRPWRDTSHLKRTLLIAGLSLALVGVAIFGALRLLLSFSGNTISAWRLVLLFGNAFFCVTIACSLYARGRRVRRAVNIPVRRSR
jgi:hypothetical protein